MKKIDKVIQIIRENMVANAPGSQGAFSDSADPKGPAAGFSKSLLKRKRYATGGRNSRAPWISYLKNK